MAWCPACIEKQSARASHDQWCHLLKTSIEDYKHEKSVGHQAHKYSAPIEKKYKPLPASIEILFEKDVAKLVSNKLPGKKKKCRSNTVHRLKKKYKALPASIEIR